MKISLDLSWFIVLFVILKVTGLIHCSWWWIAIPGGFFLVLCLFGALLGMLGGAIALWALKNGKSGKWTWTPKK